MYLKHFSVEETATILRECKAKIEYNEYNSMRLYIFYENQWLLVGNVDECEEVYGSIAWSSDKEFMDDPIEGYIKMCEEYGYGSYLTEHGIFIVNAETDG